MDAVAIGSVVELRDSCADAEQARRALFEVLAAARAPRRSRADGSDVRPHWTVTMRVTRDEALAASAMIVDDSGAVVAQRTVIDRSTRACVPLARAVGAWASLVIDDEIERSDEAPAAPPSSGFSLGPKAATSSRVDPNGVDPLFPFDEDSTPSPPKQRVVDVGTTAFFEPRDPLVMVSRGCPFRERESFTFVAFAAGAGVRSLLRCARRSLLEDSGNYIERRGLEFDLCGGVDGGIASQANESTARMSTGPSAILRCELGLWVRSRAAGVSGLGLIRPSVSGAPTPSLLAMQGKSGCR